MKVIKRNGRAVNFNPNKITARLKDRKGNLKVDTDSMAIKVISQMSDDITTEELDTLCVEIAASMVQIHPDYSILAAGLLVTQIRKSTPPTFSRAMNEVQSFTMVLAPEFLSFVNSNEEKLNNMIVHDRDFDHSVFGLRTLEKSYLLRGKGTKDNPGKLIERPQYMWLRTAIEVTGFDITKIKETYDLMSQKYYTHATPTLFNSGTVLSQLSSCFLLANKGDSVNGLFDTMKDVANISKLAGGIGLHVHDVRAKGSLIKGTNGRSDGLVPMMKTYNEVARWINQGGKRKGSFAMYLEPWHADVFDLIELKKNHGKEEMRARDLFYALWINDEFMERVENNEDWYLFCPNILKSAGIVLQELVGEDFKEAYNRAINMNLTHTVVKARDLWEKMLISQIETGGPYMGYKDRVNKSSNQKNIGTIQSSNLCIEINQYSDEKEQAVCNLASIALSRFIHKGKFNYNQFRKVVHVAIRNLDNVIDANYYPTAETETSNMKHRPIGLGVQGLADVFAIMKMPFDSPEARALNKDIFEHMYFYALEASRALSIEKGSYQSFEGSPASQGLLQFDLYNDVDGDSLELNPKLDWEGMRRDIVKDGLRNSLMIALMPTASTSQILGNNECFEPFTSNLYTRGTLSGTYVVSNEHLIRDLEEIGKWNPNIRNQLIKNNGSVLELDIPNDIKERYKTAFELSMKSVINMAADRQRFVCQAQSMNLFVKDPNFEKLSSMHFYAWKKGLKTGVYYLRTKAAVNAVKVTLDESPSLVEKIDQNDFKAMIKRGKVAAENGEDCDACGA